MILFATAIIIAPRTNWGLWAPTPACVAAGMRLYS
jgi:hypothetical protein